MRVRTPPAGTEIHLWSAPLDLDACTASALAGALADDERDRVQHFHFERDAARWAAACGWLRELLGGYLDLDPRDLRFEEGGFGKPRLRAPGPQWLRFMRCGGATRRVRGDSRTQSSPPTQQIGPPSAAGDWTLYHVDVSDAHVAAVEGGTVQLPSAPARPEVGPHGVAIAPILS